MLDLPQIAINALIYNAIICGLFAALSWNLVTLAESWRKRRQSRRSDT